ncbi:hypothetical protein GOZ97_03070 [Agrobacterium vitis]|uniref:hypothetical protein n=1 Tax=Rhizobium/Agrobacterium group TaxID=227290 RepID=UPI0008FB6273|nr:MULTISPECIES: hypothetical protein [Rhizobium/Agrobacterium group]MCF1434594.1 hypothetical protein [Allorhizobium ampelinum]MUO88455.1 hypothetical protein [Agrobacterium vitis]MUZ54429.1 hypothetical protein [Agrobacterium vitis]MUZ90391.1 hypothetical protein [Agrobacterium vitis]MVA38993.1 hypothetical protein [Agrobacterium vitis]
MQELLDAQRQMQLEADEVVRVLDLNALLREIGRPTRVGSSAMGLMVRRDIDITVACDCLDNNALAAFAGIAARLMQITDYVVAVRFRNDTGNWNIEPEKYPDGLYLWLSVRMTDGTDWTLDIWLVDMPEKQPDLNHLKTLLPRLSDTDRAVILQIKQVLAERDKTLLKIPSALVYEAVMDHGVRTFQEFEKWYSDNH